MAHTQGDTINQITKEERRVLMIKQIMLFTPKKKQLQKPNGIWLRYALCQITSKSLSKIFQRRNFDQYFVLIYIQSLDNTRTSSVEFPVANKEDCWESCDAMKLAVCRSKRFHYILNHLSPKNVGRHVYVTKP